MSQPHVGGAAGRLQGLAGPADARSNCGVGVVMDLNGGRGHDVVSDGLELLVNLEHRGTTGAEKDTGDGAGLMLQTPHAFFEDVLETDLPETYAVGSIFFPQDDDTREALVALFERTVADYDLEVLEWRDVPTDNDELGETAVESEPDVRQVVVTPVDDVSGADFDRRLYVARRALENEAADIDNAERFYVCSLDSKTIVYKGLLKGEQLPTYYPDLTDGRVESNFVMVHERFSTNTLGAWHLAHPHRTIIHNGEFNTIQGNVNWMRARETDLESDVLADLEAVKPIIDDPDQSDTASVDNALELLMQDGRDLEHALRMLVPEAWRGDDEMDEDRKDWYDFHASLVEPWDGPALVAATDGERVGAVLDRNGLRPCRYDVTADDRLIVASEAGALETDPSEIEERGRLQPGQLFLADPEEGRVIPDDEVFEGLTDDYYGEWGEREQVHVDDLRTADDETPRESVSGLREHQAAFGYTHDELENMLEPMIETGKDPVGSMGDDTPLSVLTEFNRPLFSYFRQLFAQVTNPPLDYIREELVTSMESRLGFQRNLLDESPEHARQLVLDSPILTNTELEAIRNCSTNGITAATIDITYEPESGEPGVDLEAAIERVRDDAVSAIEDGTDVLILSDREISEDRVAIPSLLATGGVHHALVRNGLRNHVGLVVESAEPRTVHQFATLVGYGAGAVTPYLAYETIADLTDGADGPATPAAIDAYVGAVEDGLLKIMAKMGISTVESYQGAQIFEAVGLDSSVVDEYFEGTENRTEGIGLAEIEADLRERHAVAFGDEKSETHLERQGEFEHRSDGIHHQWNPDTVGTLQQAARSNDYERYQEFAEQVNDQNRTLQTLRGLLEFDSDRDPIPIEEVEPVKDVVERFSTAAMSLGSLSPEAHENNSIAMNRIGGKSNSGEGGEPPERFGTEKECNVKQVASGRFGVTSTYLSSADELQIKMAQGSKPGEGGHLPGEKVNEMIAHVRKSTPGVGLISPPPLHDIYSIEDLKQLIFDLKTANEGADVNVKLVSEAGIGTVAAGVAKANADVVHISGHSGGTGASPRTSIKSAGLPWELGLAEANQMLRATGLRDRIRVSADGGLKTGRDVAVAALLGAEEYVFGTASLVTSGCVMARQCHNNTCPVGVATQRGDLRARFPGEPEHVINYMTFIAQELREIMAELGFHTVDEMIGRVEVLAQRDDIDHPKARNVDLSAVLAEPEGDIRYKIREQDHELEDHLDRDLLEVAEDAIEREEPVDVETDVSNVDRAVGAMLSNRITSRYGEPGLPEDTVTVDLEGTAGQSFGAFLASGLSMHLEGCANDYVGKGLSGGKITVRTPETAGYDPTENVAIGNVALYGATDGQLYVNGVAGERFAVRNSGAKAVVEGVGDHGCEYMTGGVVAVLGETGKNFAAGMSGGVAYVYDPDETFADRANTGMVSLHDELEEKDEQMLRRLVENHVAYTSSERGQRLLDNWERALECFVKVMPEAYHEAITEQGSDDVRNELPETPVTGASAEATEFAASDD
ncbi:glutamate synthase large subunit [Natronobacterium gregoryi]|uniref:Glutamate synthase family protein n=2 Tax=Natronobacterium gregoryi TaxID=44930 RepID=L0AMT4_NATGS|nr:glutamate synthase large subunit [Natronobacterium gregoryi]AFZ74774.1 glutamate synthase family protein [Natronobacterium gregoryi SP2]PLK19417.1 glutamate synthase large subunit [Natronobacterium gregoryi SP2]SFJ49476.1 glutamate synthase (NADPH/NADH) large chain [Natronobacterium gregoryi]